MGAETKRSTPGASCEESIELYFLSGATEWVSKTSVWQNDGFNEDHVFYFHKGRGR